MQPVSRLVPESSGAMIINGKLHRGRHGLGGNLAVLTIEPAEKLNN